MKIAQSCFLFFLVFLASCDQVENAASDSILTAEEEKAAKALVQGVFDDVWGGLDSTKILNYHTEDFIILEHGEVWDNNRITEYIRTAVQREKRPLRINKMDYISVEKHGTAIQLAYHNMADFMAGDSLVAQAQWLESATVVPTDEGLRLQQMHSTRMPRNNR